MIRRRVNDGPLEKVAEHVCHDALSILELCMLILKAIEGVSESAEADGSLGLNSDGR